MNPALQRLLLPCAIVLVLLVVAWIVLRLCKVRRTLARTHDATAAESALRAQAEALLAERLARGEIDTATHDRLLQRLWGIEPDAEPALEAGGEPALERSSSPPRPDGRQGTTGARPSGPSPGAAGHG